MKNSIALIFAVGTLFVAGCCTEHHVAKWEFKNVTMLTSAPDQDPELNQLGKEGWVIVSFVHEPADGGHNEYYRYLLKREIR